MTIIEEAKPYIVFGYGSLIFKPPPHTITETPGYLKGYVRRFAQKSHDHRGTPESPGRVVTLVHMEDWEEFSASDPFPHEDVVWGVAYTIDPAYVSEVRDYLGTCFPSAKRSGVYFTLIDVQDYREKDGYTLEYVDIYGIVDGKEAILIHQAVCYVGRKDNPSFNGSEPLDQLANTIWGSVGPSGRNKDYLYELAKAVHRLSPNSHDSHLFALEARLIELDKIHGESDASPITTWP